MSTTLERFPSPEDWRYMQGGKPTILGTTDLTGPFLVIHDYGDSRLPQSGMIVPTANEQMIQSVQNPIEVAYHQGTVIRVARVPAVLLAQHHGLPCSQRSHAANNGDKYSILGSTPIEELARSSGHIVLKLSVDKSGQQFLVPRY